MDTPPPIPPAKSKSKFEWYEHLWLGLPIALVAVGGAIGGACGGAAWAINRSVFLKTQQPVLRYVWTGLISAAAVIVYLILVTIFVSLFRRHS
jgi:hypothetical protein